MRLTKTPFLFYFIFLFSISLKGQEKVSPYELTSPRFSAGLSIGATFSNVSSNQLAFPLTGIDFNQFNIDRKANESFTIHFLYHFNAEYGIESGIIYDKKSIHLSGTSTQDVGGVESTRDVDASYRYEYFTLPILFKKTIGQQKVKASFHAGPYFSFLQSASFSDKDYTIIQDPNTGHFVETLHEQAFNIDHVARNTNIGLMIRAGAEMRASAIITPFVQAFYARSFSRIDDFEVAFPDEKNSESQFSSFGISAGVYFQMK